MDVGQIVVGAYFACLLSLGALGLHRLYLVGLYLRTRSRSPVLPAARRLPRVTVQLPVFNEVYVVDRLLDAIAALEYPRDRLEVQVLDDSTDSTRLRVARRVSELRAEGLDIVHLHRTDRTGFKAGALAAGLEQARGELIAVFDADFAPTPDFLRRTVPHFERPEIGMVQARWAHLNAESSWLTRIQAMFLDAHFAIEQAARSRSGRFFNFNGTAGVWRRQAIADAGGWQHDTLTEDLDLSYRAQLCGWQFLYLPEPAAPAELPESVAAFKSQQRRWTRGAVQTARKLLGQVWRSRLPLAVKIEATIHMTANAAYPLMTGLSLLAFPAMLWRRHAIGPDPLVADLPVLAFATGSVCVFFVAAQVAVGAGWRRAVIRLPALMALGAGISISNTLAVVQGLRGGPGTFVRTPKSGGRRGGSANGGSYRSAHGAAPLLEALMTAYLGWCTAAAVAAGMYSSLPVLLLFLAGYGYVAFLSLSDVRVHVAGMAVTRT